MAIISTLLSPLKFVGKRFKLGVYKILDLQQDNQNLNQELTYADLTSPMSFATSNYCLVIVAMTILISRIHHLVPPRTPTSMKITPTLRILLRLPSLLLLLRGILLVAAILGEKNGHNFMQYSSSRWFAQLLGWSTTFAGKSTLVSMVNAGVSSGWILDESKICWEVFLAAAASVVSEAFVRALDDDLVRQTGFNMLSFAFLLHIHSTPNPNNSIHSNHIYVHLLLVLLELFSLHLSYALNPPLPPIKLYITGFYSLVGQAFIVRALRSTWNHRLELMRGGGRAAVMNSVEASKGFEPTFFFTRLPEFGFELIIVLTLVLRLIAAALRREPITKDSILGHSSHYPVRNEDWALAMIKYGSSCVESTRLMGLANEVDPIIIRSPFSIFSSSSSSSGSNSSNLQISYMELARGSKGDISTREIKGDEKAKLERRKGKGSEGMRNEIVAVDVQSRDAFSDPMHSDPNNSKELWKFFGMIYRIVYYLVWRVIQFNKRQYRRVLRFLYLGSDSNELKDYWKVSTAQDEDDLADENYSPSSSSDEEEEDEEEDNEEMDSDSQQEEEEEVYDPTSLYRDLSSPVSRRHRRAPIASTSMIPYSTNTEEEEEEEEDSITSGENLMPIFLAHQLANSTSPLTRRRYQTLSNPNSQNNNSSSISNSSTSALSSAIFSRRQELSLSNSSNSQDQDQDQDEIESRQAERERSRTCIVCSADERTIILWPCRCLALCEDCRESIAERSNLSSSLCPTCRTPVKGFSRIFIP